MINRPKSLNTIVQTGNCSGCGGCAALAPAFIAMRETQNANRQPDISADLPVDLDAALVQACPSLMEVPSSTSAEPLEQAWGPVLEVWQGHATDPDIRFKGSSGGAVTAIALAAMQPHGDGPHSAATLHVKASLTDPRQNAASLSRSRTELLSGSGSRYAPASVADRLDLVAGAEGPCTIIGKPCDIAGVNVVASRDISADRNIGLTVSIFCAGTPSHRGTAALLQHMQKPADSPVTALRYRGEGWPGDMVARWLGGDHRSAEGRVSYGKGWGDILQKHRQWRCHVCVDHTGEQADLSIGDPWQDPPSETSAGAKAGESLIIVRTERGRRALNHAIAMGHVKARLVRDDILFAAQPNLFAAKGAVWGRRLAHGVILGWSLPLLSDSFACWRKLPFRSKLQSVFGTLKRVIQRGLYRRRAPLWLDQDSCSGRTK